MMLQCSLCPHLAMFAAGQRDIAGRLLLTALQPFRDGKLLPAAIARLPDSCDQVLQARQYRCVFLAPSASEGNSGAKSEAPEPSAPRHAFHLRPECERWTQAALCPGIVVLSAVGAE